MEEKLIHTEKETDARKKKEKDKDKDNETVGKGLRHLKRW